MLYKYKILDENKKITRSEIEAEGEPQAIKLLRDKKFIVLDIKAVSDNNIFNFFSAKITYKEKLLFVKQLSVMLEAGLTIIEALDDLKEQTTNPELLKIINKMSIEIRGGRGFSESLAKYPKIFPEMFVSMVNSGEKSGKIDTTLKRLSDQMEKEYELNSKIKSALMYPELIFIALSGIMVLSVVFIIPQIKKIFDEMDIELPLLTRMLLGFSGFVNSYWWAIIIAIAGIYFIVKISGKGSALKSFWDNNKLKIPIFGALTKQIYMSQFIESLDTLISSGIPIAEALDISKNIINNSVYKEAIERIKKDVENGNPLSKSMKKEKCFPPMMAQLIGIGEKSGKVELTLESLGKYFERDIETTTRNLTTILEPILTIIMGIGIIFVILAVIMPIYGLVNTI